MARPAEGSSSAGIQLAKVRSCFDREHAKVTPVHAKGIFYPISKPAMKGGSGGYDVTPKGDQFEEAELFFFPSTKAARSTLPALKKAVDAYPNGAELSRFDSAFYDQNVLVVYTGSPPDKKVVEPCLPGEAKPLPGTRGA